MFRPELAAFESRRLVNIDEGVKAFVHERIATLVGTHDHREPVMPNLMRCDPEKEYAFILDSVEEIPSKTIPGYSMPVEKPATLIAPGHGYG